MRNRCDWLSEAEEVHAFAQLDRIAIIERRPLNRYRLKRAMRRWKFEALNTLQR